MWPESKPVSWCEVCEVLKEFGSIPERNAWEIGHHHAPWEVPAS